MPSTAPYSAFRLLVRGLLLAAPDAPLARAVRRAALGALSPAEQDAEQAIDALRARLATSAERVEVVDYGAGTRSGGHAPVRRVADIYRNASSGRVWGRFLGTLTRELAPARVLELGTNLGLSAAHLAAGLAAGGRPDARIVTLEGARALARLAATHLDALGVGTGPGAPVEIVVGPFAETLGEVCRAHGPFDLVFVDGHHEEQATLDYIDILRPFLAPGAVVVLDDVEPGRAVWRAWRRLRAAEPHRDAVYLGRMGLLTLGDPAGATADAAVRLGSTDPQPMVAAYEALPPERSRMRDPSL